MNKTQNIKMLPEGIVFKETNKNVFSQVLKETANTFVKKVSKFIGISKTFQPRQEDLFTEEELKFKDASFNPLNFESEYKEPDTSIKERLTFLKDELSDFIDNSISIEKTNASGKTKTTLIVNGVSFGEFSSLELLSMRSALKTLKPVYEAIPTNERNDLIWDSTNKMYKTSPVKTLKSKEVEDVRVVSKANQFQKEDKLKNF